MSLPSVLAFLSMPNGYEWIIILVIALLLFGRRLPDVMRSLGSSAREFKKGLEDGVDDKKGENDKKQEPTALPKQDDAPGTAARTQTAEPDAPTDDEPRNRDL